MALNSLLSVRVLPSGIVRYTATVQRLAEMARKKKDPFSWGAYETAYGGEPRMHFVSSADTFAALGKRGTVPELIARVLGAADAPRALEELGASIASQQMTISVDRPDLSYVAAPIKAGEPKAAVVTRAVVRPGSRQAYEEMLRKIAEAIPKLGEPAQLITRQTVVGNVAEYAAIRPLRELGEIDAQRTPDQLLTQAFGPDEGGRIFRSGGEAIVEITREIVVYRADLSNPAA